MNWSNRRKLLIFLLVTTVVVSTLFVVVAPYVFVAPTCSDGVRNGTEEGVDCGGTCALLCKQDTSVLNVVWSRAVPVTATTYDAAAYVSNTEVNAALPFVHYRFTLYDTFGGTITTRDGVTAILPNGITPIVETNILVGAKVPVRTRLTFLDDSLNFQKLEKTPLSDIQIMQTDFNNIATTPSLTAHVTNPTDETLQNISWLALLYDADGTLFATGKTIVQTFPYNSSMDIFFTWKQPLSKPARIEIIPVADPFSVVSTIK